jgi:hypothetical protein
VSAAEEGASRRVGIDDCGIGRDQQYSVETTVEERAVELIAVTLA